MDSKNIEKINEETLEKVSGGYEGYDLVNMDELPFEVLQYDSNGNPIKWKRGSIIWHFQCPKCAGYMHWGTRNALYCDPCDDYWRDLDKQYEFRVIDEY
ncbi:MAG: hypothetical protein Q4C42_11110 [Clostridia bacterium]|nr:hypothetical protein [Clostridia bacterium]